MMKRLLMLAGMSVALMTVTAQNNPYIVKTKGVKPVVKTAKVTSDG